MIAPGAVALSAGATKGKATSSQGEEQWRRGAEIGADGQGDHYDSSHLEAIS